jgi:hypothetical protein
MNKPKKKSDWADIAAKLEVKVDGPDTKDEIVKNIGDKLGIPSKGQNFENRVWDAAKAELTKPAAPVVEETEATPDVAETANEEVTEETPEETQPEVAPEEPTAEVETPEETKEEAKAPKFKRNSPVRKHNPMNFRKQ